MPLPERVLPFGMEVPGRTSGSFNEAAVLQPRRGKLVGGVRVRAVPLQ